MTLDALQEWYSTQCDGDWEHDWGIKIETLDNPGWRLRVNLVGTALEGKVMARKETERSESDWFQTWSDGQTFDGAGGGNNLGDLLAAFANFVKPS
jgi:hypothetical protein